MLIRDEHPSWWTNSPYSMCSDTETNLVLLCFFSSNADSAEMLSLRADSAASAGMLGGGGGAAADFAGFVDASLWMGGEGVAGALDVGLHNNDSPMGRR